MVCLLQRFCIAPGFPGFGWASLNDLTDLAGSRSAIGLPAQMGDGGHPPGWLQLVRACAYRRDGVLFLQSKQKLPKANITQKNITQQN